MNIGLVIAGGSGNRMGMDIPKQFIVINDKPIIIYTIEAFEKHPLIDYVLVVCIQGWEKILEAYGKQFGLTKIKYVVTGGSTGQESIRNGVEFLNGKISEEDIVIIHDGIRPLVDEEVISDVILTAEKYGNAVTALPYNEQIFVIKDDKSTNKYILRETLRRVQTPQAYKYKTLLWGYRKAFRENIGIHGSSYTNTMMVDLGETLYFATGSEKNIKLTNHDDLILFKAMLNEKERK